MIRSLNVNETVRAGKLKQLRVITETMDSIDGLKNIKGREDIVEYVKSASKMLEILLCNPQTVYDEILNDLKKADN